jgi:hypothetical protein
MTTTSTNTTNKPTTEQLNAWKKEHGVLHSLSTEDGYEAIVRSPRLTDLEQAMDKSKKPGARSLDFNRVLFRRCCLWNSDGLMDDEDRQLQILTAIGSISDVKEATVKKI